MARWKFATLDGLETYTMDMSPNEAASPIQGRSVAWTYSREGYTGTRAGRVPTTWSFSGTLRTEEQFEAFVAWLNKRVKIRVTTDLGETYVVRLVSFVPEAARSRRQAPHRHTYVFNCLITEVGAVVPPPVYDPTDGGVITLFPVQNLTATVPATGTVAWQWNLPASGPVPTSYISRIIDTATETVVQTSSLTASVYGSNPFYDDVTTTTLGKTFRVEVAPVYIAQVGPYATATVTDVPPVTDTFNRANSTLVGSTTSDGRFTWQMGYRFTNGTLAIANQLVTIGAGEQAAYVSTVSSTADQSILIPGPPGTTHQPALLTRYVDASNWIRLEWIDSLGAEYKLTVCTAGTQTNFFAAAPRPTSESSMTTMRLVAEGTSVKAYFNGALKHDRTVTQHATSKNHGIAAFGSGVKIEEYNIIVGAAT